MISVNTCFSEESKWQKIYISGQIQGISDSWAEKPVGWIHMKKEQREWWAAKEGNHGVLYYYMKTGRLEFFSVADKIDLPVCLRNC